MDWTVENLSDYGAPALKTAIYPGRNTYTGLMYATLGLVGEVGEVAEKMTNGHARERIGAELGDALWYINALADECDGSLGSLEYDLVEGLHDVTLFSYADTEQLVHELVVQAAAIANCVKKGLRDDAGERTRGRTAKLDVLLLTTLNIWLQLVRSLSLDPYDIAAQNLTKLFDRKDRGVLGGDGDKR